MAERLPRVEDRVAPRVSSYMVPMSDGVRLALDLVLPPTDAAAPFATVMMASRYWRSFAMRVPGRPGRAPLGPRAPLADRLSASGYATVIVDTRGTGASEGEWPYPWSPREVADLAEVVDWIVAQPWSNGNVGATGISYEGTTAMLLAATGHPAVKAVAPRSFEYDVYPDIAFPGGVLNEAFMSAWSDTTLALDRNRVPRMFGIMGRLLVKGVRPVDEDPGGRRLAEIVRGRTAASVSDAIRDIEFRDDQYGDEDVTFDHMSVRHRADAIRAADVPAQVWASWRDGTTADAALRMFDELPSLREIRVGAWSHTGEQHASPFAEGGTPNPPLDEQWEAVIDFLDPLLRGSPPTTPASGERLIHYYVMGAEEWRSTPTWPPAGVRSRMLYPYASSELGTVAPTTTAIVSAQLDASASTGTANRWHTQLAKPVRYGDRSRADRMLLTWTGPPSSEPLEISGHPEVRLRMRTDGTDPLLFVYLEALDPRGRVLSLSEGMLRAVHRATRGAEPTFLRADARPPEPGQWLDMHIRMLPLSVVLPPGWALRLALAGADRQTFRAPDSPHDLAISLEFGADDPFALTLPVRR